MMGGAKAHYDGIVAFSQTDFTEDLKKISVPVLVMHGDDDQIVPYADSGPIVGQAVKNGTLKTYSGFPHGMPTTKRRRSTPTCWRSFRRDSHPGLRKRVGGHGAFQLRPDVRRVPRRSRGHHDAARGCGHHKAGDLMEVMLTDLRHVVVGDARPE